MLGYKLTNPNGSTIYGNSKVRWKEGFTYDDPQPKTRKLCGPGWIHFYKHRELVDYWNPTHAQYPADAILWEIETSGSVLEEHDKCGARTITALRRVSYPKWSNVQRTRMAIFCALETGIGNTMPNWKQWGIDFLSDARKGRAPRVEVEIEVGDRNSLPKNRRSGTDDFWSARSAYYSVMLPPGDQIVSAANAGIQAGRVVKIDYMALAKIAKSPARCREYLKEKGLQ